MMIGETMSKLKTVKFKDGLAIIGTFPNPDVALAISDESGLLPLTIADPPYGNVVNEKWDKAVSDVKFCAGMIDWTKWIGKMTHPGGALYVWGGIGRPGFRPFYRYMYEVEANTLFSVSNHITWSKKRAYGVSHNYLFTREELAYLVKGNIKKPRMFNIPLLETKRGYAGYNAKYPAKSEYLRRTSVWTDITEIFQGKVHVAQKPQRLMEIPIEIHTQKGEYVLDPFAGSGTTAHAARALGRKFVVVEQNKDTFEKMVESLK
jgi:DNA modification methylase